MINRGTSAFCILRVITPLHWATVIDIDWIKMQLHQLVDVPFRINEIVIKLSGYGITVCLASKRKSGDIKAYSPIFPSKVRTVVYSLYRN